MVYRTLDEKPTNRYNAKQRPDPLPPRAGPRFFFGLETPKNLTLILSLKVISVDLVRLEIACNLAG